MPDRDDPPPAPEPSTPLVDAQHPWLGLLPFKEVHRDFFFGRDAEIAEILDRIGENTLTVLFGQSGLGKTSLLGAGVVPRLREAGFAPVLLRLDYDPGAPSLLEQTRTAFRQANPDAAWQEDAAAVPLWELFHRLPALLPTGSPAPVLLFDQFEEIFTLGRQEPAREREAELWLEQMADLLQNRPSRALEERFAGNRRLARDYDFGRSPLRVVFSLREDFLSHLEGWKIRLPLLTQNRMAVHLLDGPQALEAVLGPASIAEDPLVGREVAAAIVRTVARVPPETPLPQIKAVPPLLSLLCEQLNAARLDAGATEITSDMVTGQSDDILQRFYEESFADFPAEHRDTIRGIIEDRMVTVGEHRHPVAREDAEAELAARNVPDPKSVFDALIQRRLLTAEEHAGLQRLEVTHDVLVPLLVRSRKERRDRVAKELAERRLREEAAKTRKRRLLIAGMAALTLIAVASAIYGVGFAMESKRQRDAANDALRKEREASLALAVSRSQTEEARARAVNYEASALEATEAATASLSRFRMLESQALLDGEAARRDAENAKAAAAEALSARSSANEMADYLMEELPERFSDIGQLEVVEGILYSVKRFIDDPNADLGDGSLKRKIQFLLNEGRLREAQGNLPKARVAYESALGMAREQSAANPKEPKWRILACASLRNFGIVQKAQGSLDSAIHSWKEALLIAQELATMPGDDSGFNEFRPNCLFLLAGAAFIQGNLDEAISNNRSGQEIFEAHFSKYPVNATQILSHAFSYGSLAEILMIKGDYDGAQVANDLFNSKVQAASDAGISPGIGLLGSAQLALNSEGNRPPSRIQLDQALAAVKKLTGWDSSNAEWQASLAAAHWTIGRQAGISGDFDTAVDNFNEARKLSDRLVALDSTNSEWRSLLASASMMQGANERLKGDWGTSRNSLDTARKILEHLADQDPTRGQHQADLAECLNQLSLTAQVAGKLDECRGFLDKALAVSERLLKSQPSNPSYALGVSGVWNSMALNALETERFSEARRAAVKALGITEKLVTPNSPIPEWREHLWADRLTLGAVEVRAESWNEARRLYGRALAVCQSPASRKDSDETWIDREALTLLTMCAIEASDSKPQQAYPYGEQATSLRRILAGKQPKDSERQLNLAESLMLLGSLQTVLKLDVARATIAEAIRILQELEGNGTLGKRGEKLLVDCEKLAKGTRKFRLLPLRWHPFRND